MNTLDIEYAVVFNGVDYHPLGKKTPRQVKRYLDGLVGTGGGEVTVVSRGIVQTTGDWVSVAVNEDNYPAIPDVEALGLGVHKRTEHRPLVDPLGEPRVPALIPVPVDAVDVDAPVLGTAGAEHLVAVATAAPVKRAAKAPARSQ